MFIHSALLEAFKNIISLDIRAKGNHIVVEGLNGVGKSAVLEALLTLLFGKKLLPDDPVMHGKESALIECGLCNEKGDEIAYKIKSRISKKVFSLSVSTFTPGGHEMSIKKPVEFLSGIVTRNFIDPDEFVRIGGKQRIKMLYDLLPDLREKIDELDKQYENEQFKRSQINIDKGKLEAELINNPLTKDLPDKEIDPATLLAELQEAESHNLEKQRLVGKSEDLGNEIDKVNEMAMCANEDIEALKLQIAEKERLVVKLSGQIDDMAALKAEKEVAIDNFKEKDTESIKDRLSKLNDTNRAIRTNQKRALVEKGLAEKSTQYSAGLSKMKEIEEEKISVYRNVKMPIDGLEVGEADITFPDPNTNERVAFGSLSTGQKIRVAVGILAKFLPEPKDGLRCMVINDANAMDKGNYKAMLAAANANGVQLILHRTLFESKSNELEVIIEGKDEDQSK